MRELIQLRRNLVIFPPRFSATPIVEGIQQTYVTSVSPFTYNMPTPSPDDDFYITPLVGDQDIALTFDVAWTVLFAQTSPSSDINIKVGYRVGSSEPETYEATHSGSGYSYAGVLRISGVDNSDPINDYGVGTGTGAVLTAPDVDPVDEANTLVLRFFAADPTAGLGPKFKDGQDFEYSTVRDYLSIGCMIEEGPALNGATGTRSVEATGSMNWIASTVVLNRA